MIRPTTELQIGPAPGGTSRLSWGRLIGGSGLIMGAAAVTEFAIGRKIWGARDAAGLWTSAIASSHTSQYLFDPYTFTHVTHGALFCGALALLFRNLPPPARLLFAVGLESAWEVFENTSMIIQRYRAETISLNYYGDSIVNSMGDILACILGFVLASRLPRQATVIGVIGLEILLALWTRDNLALNIIMLIHPSPAVRAWQSGR